MTTQIDTPTVKEIKETIEVPNIVANLFCDFMRWKGIGLTIDFNGLMQVIAQLEKRGYVVVIDCENTYLHYPAISSKKFDSFKNNVSKIQGVYRACLTAIKHYYHY
jgi:hypothetical protein